MTAQFSVPHCIRLSEQMQSTPASPRRNLDGMFKACRGEEERERVLFCAANPFKVEMLRRSRRWWSCHSSSVFAADLC